MSNLLNKFFDGNSRMDYDYGKALLCQGGGWTSAELYRDSSLEFSFRGDSMGDYSDIAAATAALEEGGQRSSYIQLRRELGLK